MPYERIIEVGITEGVLVRLGQSGRPINRYSVVLMALVDGAWETIRVYDNHLGGASHASLHSEGRKAA